MPLIFTSLCLPYKTPAVFSKHIWTALSTLPLFSLEKILVEPLAALIGKGCHVCRKHPNENAENEA